MTMTQVAMELYKKAETVLKDHIKSTKTKWKTDMMDFGKMETYLFPPHDIPLDLQ